MRRLLPLMLLWALGCRHGQPQPPLAALVTTPIPLPAPAVPRHKLSPQLQELWTRVELAVAVAPPSPPADATDATIKEWAGGPFTEWISARARATTYALQATYAMRVQPAYERGVGTALYAYMYEDLVNAIRGAPVPENIAHDAHLLEIYTTELHKYLKPYAIFAAQGYGACLGIFTSIASRDWHSWAEYCDQRGSEVVETYGLTDSSLDEVPADPQDATTPPAQSDPTSTPTPSTAPVH